MSTPTIIRLKLDTSRDDKGKTANYHVYAATETMTVQNGKAQPVVKNVIMGANGTVYVGNPVAEGIHEWVLVPAMAYDEAMTELDRYCGTKSAPSPSSKKKGK